MLRIFLIIVICLFATSARAYSPVIVSSDATLVTAGQKYTYRVHRTTENITFIFYDPNSNLTAIEGLNVNALCYLTGHRKYTCHMYTSGDLYFTLVPDYNYSLCDSALNPIIEPTSKVELPRCNTLYLPKIE